MPAASARGRQPAAGRRQHRLDPGTEGRVQDGGLNQKSILFVNEVFDPPVAEADIEDLIDPAVYEDLVRRSYAKELAKVTLKLNDKVPRIVKRFELAFDEKRLTFDKVRPARLFLAEMASRPDELVDAASKSRFQKLFALIVKRMATTMDGAA